jgi:hypothetical protein
MGCIIYRKSTECCGTCVYWGGKRQFDTIPSVSVDPGSFGACTNGRCNGHHTAQGKMASEMHCSYYELHPTLR